MVTYEAATAVGNYEGAIREIPFLSPPSSFVRHLRRLRRRSESRAPSSTVAALASSGILWPTIPAGGGVTPV